MPWPSLRKYAIDASHGNSFDVQSLPLKEAMDELQPFVQSASLRGA
jgi:hypothetical protein